MMGNLLTPNGAEDTGRTLQTDATTCAVAILIERVHGLPKDDREDLYELAKIVFSCDDAEEREAAGEAMIEILAQKPSKVSPYIKASEREEETIKQWTNYVSHAVRKARKSSQLTQEQLAERSGIQQSHISRIEKGQVSPTHKTLKKIAFALNVDIKEFDPCAEPD